MKTKYLSHAQACAIRRDFLHLKGYPLDENHRIEQIIVTPYSRILQWQYLQSLMRNEKPEPATNVRNPMGRHDVLLVAKTDREPGFITKDLRSYLKEHSLPFEPARYSCLRHLQPASLTIRKIPGCRKCTGKVPHLDAPNGQSGERRMKNSPVQNFLLRAH